MPCHFSLYNSFFFQAEDGIRDYKVTGVQTCALPIYHLHKHPHMLSIYIQPLVKLLLSKHLPGGTRLSKDATIARSEERRVGKEGEYTKASHHNRKKKKRHINKMQDLIKL